MRCNKKHCSGCHSIQNAQRVWMADFHVIQGYKRFRDKKIDHRFFNNSGITNMRVNERFTRQQRGIDDARGLAFSGSKKEVTTTQCQAIAFTNGWLNTQLHIDIQITHELPNNRNLLGIFLTVISDIRLPWQRRDCISGCRPLLPVALSMGNLMV